MLVGWLRAARPSPPQVSIHPIYPSTLYPSISSRYHGGGRREIIGCLHVPAAAEGRQAQITTERERERDGGRRGEISGRRRDLIRGCRREEEGRGEEDDTRSLNHSHIPHRAGASSSDKTPLLSPFSLPLSPSVPLFLFCSWDYPRGGEKRKKKKKSAQRTRSENTHRYTQELKMGGLNGQRGLCYCRCWWKRKHFAFTAG